jgi:hypothetical protein
MDVTAILQKTAKRNLEYPSLELILEVDLDSL